MMSTKQSTKVQPIFYVDLPDPTLRAESDDNAYIHVTTLPTRDSAREWLLGVHGMPTEVADFFITEGSAEVL